MFLYCKKYIYKHQFFPNLNIGLYTKSNKTLNTKFPYKCQTKIGFGISADFDRKWRCIINSVKKCKIKTCNS